MCDDSLTIAGPMRAESPANDPEVVYGIGLSERHPLLVPEAGFFGRLGVLQKAPNVSMASAYPRQSQWPYPTFIVDSCDPNEQTRLAASQKTRGFSRRPATPHAFGV